MQAYRDNRPVDPGITTFVIIAEKDRMFKKRVALYCLRLDNNN